MTPQDAAMMQNREQLEEVSGELRDHINRFLQDKGLPMRFHSVHLTDGADADGGEEYHCCIINGKYVCSPLCP